MLTGQMFLGSSAATPTGQRFQPKFLPPRARWLRPARAPDAAAVRYDMNVGSLLLEQQQTYVQVVGVGAEPGGSGAEEGRKGPKSAGSGRGGARRHTGTSRPTSARSCSAPDSPRSERGRRP
jgi:hypothetical protein